MSKALIGLGVWIISDGWYSWALYLNAHTYGSDSKQTFWRDHYIRLIRMLCGVGIIVIGVMSE